MTADFALISHPPTQLFESAVGKPAHRPPCLASVSGEQPVRFKEAVQVLSKCIDIAIRRFAPLYLLDLLRCRQECGEQSAIGRLNKRPKECVCRPDQSLMEAEGHDRFV